MNQHHERLLDDGVLLEHDSQRRRLNPADSPARNMLGPWTRCSQENMTVLPNFTSLDNLEQPPLRIMWYDEGIGRVRGELDCFLMCFPTQLIPALCTTSGLETAPTAASSSSTSSSSSSLPPSSATVVSSGGDAATTESDIFKYIAILLMATIEKTPTNSFQDLWMDHIVDCQATPSFGIRFGMSFHRFDQISRQLRIETSPVSVHLHSGLFAK
jgi:hypothetical protein